ncbi:hypothetical protein FGO68_gene16821 [Halteria grandinella]|uniref:Uncharacterized protein n=1 Tax=Halteria grandinella TaxID=5974 RepID=A0A8J8NZ32_HALGN|nr:hypothetical protein FGO68_gene16821 [Halteria grandinella]
MCFLELVRAIVAFPQFQFQNDEYSLSKYLPFHPTPPDYNVFPLFSWILVSIFSHQLMLQCILHVSREVCSIQLIKSNSNFYSYQ